MGNVIRTPTVQARTEPPSALAAPPATPVPAPLPPEPPPAAQPSGIQHEYEQWRLAAQQQGYQEGFLQGEKQAQQQANELLGELRALLTSLPREREQALAATEQLALPVVLAALTRLLGQWTPDAGTVRHAIEQALAEAKPHEVFKVRLHPRVAALLLTEGQTHLTDDHGRALQVFPDPEVAGGCVLETSFGEIDAQWTTQLVRLRQALLRADQI